MPSELGRTIAPEKFSRKLIFGKTGHPDKAIGPVVLYLAKVAADDALGSVDNANVFAQFFYLLHSVAREQHNRTVVDQLTNGVFDDLDIDWIKPREWLI